MSLFKAGIKKPIKVETPADDYRPIFIQPGQFPRKDIKVAGLIQQRRVQMLIHSCLYYEMNTSTISDKQFDAWGKELAQLQNDNPEIADNLCFAYAFKDWDGTTGFHLPLKNKWVVGKANYILSINR